MVPTGSNARHQLDLACRNATTTIMADATKEEKKVWGKRLAEAKKALLEAAKGDVEQLEEELTRGAPDASSLGEKVACFMRARAA